MSDDLVSRLREPLSQLPGDDDALMERVVSDRDEAATALTEARAEIERLQRALFFWMPGVDERLDPATRELAADDAGLLAGYSDTSDKPCWGDGMIDRALAAETELSTLRVRVREVVGPFAAIEATGWTGSYLAEPAHDGSDVSILYHAASNTTVNRGHFRAAKLLMEELK